jgi:hypothetical protein
MTSDFVPFAAQEPAVPFLLHFLEISHERINGQQTGGAPTDTETGDSNGPTRKDTVEDEDITRYN